MNRIKQIFLFLIPTLVAALLFITINQENILTADAVDYDYGTIIKTESPDTSLKNLHNCIPLFVFYVPNLNNPSIVLSKFGKTADFIFLNNYIENLSGIKNHSPPLNAMI